MLSRLRPLSLAALALLIVGMSASSSFGADAGMGTFHFGKIRFAPLDALAYPLEATKDTPAMTVVLLTDFKIDRKAAVDAIDPASELIDQASRSEPGDLLIIRVLSASRCGLSAYLNQAQKQIDLSNDFSAKSVSATATRVAGSCATTTPGKMFDDVYDFHLSYDLPLTAIARPSVLPAGGGEPGAVYAALVKAIQSRDWNVAALRLPPDQVPKKRPPAAEMGRYFEGLALNYPKSVTIKGGLMKLDRANLEIEGTNNEGKKIKGTVAMKRTGTEWRVLDQGFYFTE